MARHKGHYFLFPLKGKVIDIDQSMLKNFVYQTYVSP